MQQYFTICLTVLICLGNSAFSLHAQTGRTHTVKIEGFKYVPETIEIEVGDSVKWTNQDASPHTASRDDVPAFETGLLAKDKSNTIQFNKASNNLGFEYFCRPHPFMKGHVVVRLRGSLPLRMNQKATAESAPVSAPKTVDVEIKNFRYHPQTIEIQVGDTIRWTNRDDAGHSATQNDSPAFDTGILGKNKSKEITFSEPSTSEGFEYFCRPHPNPALMPFGRVIVRARGSVKLRPE